jgi:hypothetical protein
VSAAARSCRPSVGLPVAAEVALALVGAHLVRIYSDRIDHARRVDGRRTSVYGNGHPERFRNLFL